MLYQCGEGCSLWGNSSPGKSPGREQGWEWFFHDGMNGSSVERKARKQRNFTFLQHSRVPLSIIFNGSGSDETQKKPMISSWIWNKLVEFARIAEQLVVFPHASVYICNIYIALCIRPIYKLGQGPLLCTSANLLPISDALRPFHFWRKRRSNKQLSVGRKPLTRCP